MVRVALQKERKPKPLPFLYIKTMEANKEKILKNKERFLQICEEELNNVPGMEKLLGWISNSDFYTAPASTKFHGNYEGGLLEHSLNVYDILTELSERYLPESHYPQKTIAIVALFHDLCKANFYKKERRNVKNQKTGQWEEKEIWTIDEQIPLGHGEKSCLIIQRFVYLTLEELLAIRWHMGGFDAAVKGGERGYAKAQEMSKLVSLLSIADQIASNLIEEEIKS